LERAEVLPFERRYCLNRWTPICGRTGSVQLDVRLDLVRRDGIFENLFKDRSGEEFLGGGVEFLGGSEGRWFE
jgi:hypothetical protein